MISAIAGTSRNWDADATTASRREQRRRRPARQERSGDGAFCHDARRGFGRCSARSRRLRPARNLSPMTPSVPAPAPTSPRPAVPGGEPAAAALAATAAIAALPDGIQVWDASGRLVAWNEAFIALFPTLRGRLYRSMTIADLAGLAYDRVAPAGVGLRREEFVAQRLALFGGDAGGWDCPLTPDRTIEVRDRRTADGGVVSVYRDMTEMRLSQSRLRETETQFRDGIESMIDGFVLLDPEDRLLAWNQAYLTLVPYMAGILRPGIRFAEMVEKGARARDPGAPAAEIAGVVERRMSQHVAAGAPFEIETAGAGRIIEAIERRTSIGGMVIVLRDVTRRRLAERRQRETEARFRDGIESMAEGFTLWDGDDRLRAWNRRYLEMFPERVELVRDGIAFQAFNEAILRRRHPGATAAQLAEMIAERIHRHREPGGVWETVLPDGRVIEVVEQPTSDGGRVAVHRDATARRREQAALMRLLAVERDLNAQQRRFVAIASHEFRTPMAVIDGAAQRIAARLGPDADPDLRRRLDRIRSAITRMTDMIDMTLSSARLDEGRLSLAPQQVDLGRLLGDVVARHRTISPRIAIDFAQPALPLPIECDPKLVDQIFSNLLSNAIKYSASGTTVQVTIDAAVDGASVSVRDEGVGIPADEIPKLFNRFFRARTAAGIQGTGIGLHLVKELVQLHGGAIEVASEVGHGSVFTVRLPARIAGTAGARAGGDTPPPGRLGTVEPPLSP
ncbi:MAG: PAS-domain containing protein [Alphaproteobacteria bacterium]|nr:PAS-domain containing protein [Alphaproteobacteria bacterium]